MYKGYFFDLDGVAYRGSEVIETCRDFVNQLMDQGIKVCFLTNNSSRTPEQVATHLQELGYRVEAKNILNSSRVTAHYLQKQKKKRVYMIGMTGLTHELIESGCEIVSEDADFVVVGLDRHLTYEKMEQACYELKKGAQFIATNGDKKLSTSIGIAPGNGAIVKVIEETTGVKPLVMGKPEPSMFEYGLELLGLEKHEVVMVGDNYFTDIQGAIHFGIDSIFVETGVMTKEEILMFDNQPTYIVNDLSEFND